MVSRNSRSYNLSLDSQGAATDLLLLIQIFKKLADINLKRRNPIRAINREGKVDILTRDTEAAGFENRVSSGFEARVGGVQLREVGRGFGDKVNGHASTIDFNGFLVEGITVFGVSKEVGTVLDALDIGLLDP